MKAKWSKTSGLHYAANIVTLNSLNKVVPKECWFTVLTMGRESGRCIMTRVFQFVQIAARVEIRLMFK